MSALDQREDRELEGVTVDRRFVGHVSGKDIKRPQLIPMLSFVREGDTVVCHSMDRLCRNLDDLRKLVFGLTERGLPRLRMTPMVNCGGCATLQD